MNGCCSHTTEATMIIKKAAKLIIMVVVVVVVVVAVVADVWCKNRMVFWWRRAWFWCFFLRQMDACDRTKEERDESC